MSHSTSLVTPVAPEKLSKHALVNYLIANPESRGNFKYHTLLSCMWRDLLIAQPGFQDVADFQKIHHRDAFKILLEQPQLAKRFDWVNLWQNWQDECLQILKIHPQLATTEKTSFLRGFIWSELLRKRPELAHLCNFKKFYAYEWINLVTGQECFADRCPWQKFRTYDWINLVGKKKRFLKFLKLEYLDSEESLQKILRKCYFGDAISYKGCFEEQKIEDAASFLIFKRMDRGNGKRYLKKQLKSDNWEFVEQLCELSPEDAMDVEGKKYMPFYMTLMAPDSVFEKLAPCFDLSSRDPGGNSLLLPALVHGLCNNAMERYSFLRRKGLDPDEKNSAGFSCNDLNSFVEDIRKG